jgi:hypothetical protein
MDPVVSTTNATSSLDDSPVHSIARESQMTIKVLAAAHSEQFLGVGD